MGRPLIDSLYSANQGLVQYLTANSEITHLQVAEDSFRKTLVLAAASLFEEWITEIITIYIHKRSAGDSGVVSFVKRKAIEGQYFRWFTWDAKNCNAFFNQFGDEFGGEMKSEVAADEQLKGAALRFLELGHLRNCMVHQNFAAFTFDKTADEVYQLYKDARVFVEYLSKKMT